MTMNFDYDQELKENKEKYPDLPTKEQLVLAFRNININERDKQMLAAHYYAPHRTASAKDLALSCGYTSYQVANTQYGRIANKLCSFLNRDYSFYIRILAVLCGWSNKGGVYWIMHPQVAEALEELGWVGGAPLDEEDWKQSVEEESRKAATRSPQERQARLAQAPRIPQQMEVRRREFRRNADVVAEVMFRAKGRCEDCGREAPFKRKSDGSPFLEIHHIITLAEGGEDTVQNALALCPNCHRKRHYG